MANVNSGISIPTIEDPIAEPAEVGKQPRTTFIWWRFFQELVNRTANTIPYLTATGIVAAGTTQATATELNDEWNQVVTTPVNSGVVITPFGTGTSVTVWNNGANSLKVYPPVGYDMDGGAVNAPYALAAGKVQIFSQLDDTSFRSTQLG